MLQIARECRECWLQMEFRGPVNYFLGKKKKKAENKTKCCPQGTNLTVGLVADDLCGFQKTRVQFPASHELFAPTCNSR